MSLQTTARSTMASSDAIVRRLYGDAWFGGVTLVAVDAEQTRALVKLESGAPKRVAFDVIDLAAGARLERWEASPAQAEQLLTRPHFAPLSGTLTDDARRMGALLRAFGPWHGRGGLTGPVIAAGPAEGDLAIGASPSDGSPGDWLYWLDGRGSVRIDEGLRASYAPVISPDGRAIAFRGCTASPCDYGLYVARRGEPRPHRVAGVSDSSAALWTASGTTLLATGSRNQERCLFSASATAMGTAQPIRCVRGLADTGFAVDPSGGTAVFGGTRGKAGTHALELTWSRLDTGAELATRRIPGGIAVGSLGPAGLVALPMPRGALGIADLTTGQAVTLSEQKGWFFGFEAARWKDERVVLARKLEGERAYEIVSVDTRGALPPTEL
jgi:hypothetical protein